MTLIFIEWHQRQIFEFVQQKLFDSFQLISRGVGQILVESFSHETSFTLWQLRTLLVGAEGVVVVADADVAVVVVADVDVVGAAAVADSPAG